MISVPLVTLICEWLISCYPLRYAYYVSKKKKEKKRKKEILYMLTTLSFV